MFAVEMKEKCAKNSVHLTGNWGKSFKKRKVVRTGQQRKSSAKKHNESKQIKRGEGKIERQIGPSAAAAKKYWKFAPHQSEGRKKKIVLENEANWKHNIGTEKVFWHFCLTFFSHEEKFFPVALKLCEGVCVEPEEMWNEVELGKKSFATYQGKSLWN